MTAKKPDQHQDDLAAKEAAEQALQAVQTMPVGPERVAALRKAGQMRFDACRGRYRTEYIVDNDS
jgi:hypothetical protein